MPNGHDSSNPAPTPPPGSGAGTGSGTGQGSGTLPGGVGGKTKPDGGGDRPPQTNLLVAAGVGGLIGGVIGGLIGSYLR